MEFRELSGKALGVAGKYDQFNQLKIGRKWTNSELAQGMVGDVGDLMKLVMAKEGARQIDNVDEKLEHELADVLWCVVVLADRYGIDLERSFIKNMDQLDQRVDGLIQGETK